MNSHKSFLKILKLCFLRKPTLFLIKSLKQRQNIQYFQIFFLVCFITQNFVVAATTIQVALIGIVFVTSMFTPKWIGVQTRQTIQLIFFSQLLITQVNKWPSAFSAFKYFKYSNGLNHFLTQNLIASSVNSKKWIFLGFQSIFILDFWLNLSLILVFIIFFSIAVFIRSSRQFEYYKQLQNKKNSAMKQSLRYISNISQKFYEVLLNLTVWSTLQCMASLASQLQTLDGITNNYDLLITTQFNSFLIFLSITFIFIVCLNNCLNMFHNLYTLRKLQRKPQLQRYKWINNLYHIFIGVAIFYFNSFSIKQIPISVLIIIFQLAYILYLYKNQPYKQCVKIHSIGIFFNRLVFLVFLGFITLINFVPDINEVVMLGMCYFIVSSAFIVIILSFVRLYYDIRYGEELQNKLRQQREAKQLMSAKLKKLKLQIQLEQIKQNALQENKISKKQKERSNNKFLYQNQVKEDEQLELLRWLQKIKNMTKQDKQAHYYAIYRQKPLKWLKTNDTKQYQRRVKEEEDHRNASKKKKDLIDEQQLQKVKARLKEELIQKKMSKDKRVKH